MLRHFNLTEIKQDFNSTFINFRAKKMESILTKSILVTILTLTTIITGILLRKGGKPYKSRLFTVHKLAIVATIVFVVLIYIQHLRILNFEGIGFILFILSSLIFLTAFISGAFLSFEKFSTFKIQFTHWILSWLTILFIPIIWLVCH